MRKILCGDVLYHMPNTLKMVVGPADRFQVDPDDGCVIDQGSSLVVWKGTELTILALLGWGL
jgi:hypothetical protein